MSRGVIGGLATPATKQRTADNCLKHRERIMHSDDFTDKIKVDEEQNNSKIDEGERSRHEKDSTHL